jgi:hypothetical protein
MWDELRLALVAGLVRALLLLALRFVCLLSPPRSLLLADSACWLWLQAPTSLNEGRGVVGFALFGVRRQFFDERIAYKPVRRGCYGRNGGALVARQYIGVEDGEIVRFLCECEYTGGLEALGEIP